MSQAADGHPQAIAATYDAVSVLYTQFVGDGVTGRPIDRAVLDVFARLVIDTGHREVADLGCGPGHLTAYLQTLQLCPFGVDLSANLIGIARRTYPRLRFDVGSMANVAVADEALGGVLSWYSLIHISPQDIHTYFAEFHRVLSPGGLLLVGFFEADDDTITPFEHTVAPA